MKTNRSDWSEERIKVLLSQLPKVEDNRSSKQIYQQMLMASGQKKKSAKWIGPAVATVVVLFMAFLISPHLFQPAAQDHHKQVETSADKSQVNATLEAVKQTDGPSHVVSRKQQQKYMTIAYIDESTSQVVPISIEKEDEYDHLQEMMNTYGQVQLPEMTKPLQSYIDMVDLREKGDTLIFQLKNDLSLDTLKEANRFKDMVKETLKWSKYKRVQVKTSKGSQLQLGANGRIGTMSIEKQTKHAYYVLDNKSGTFLVPSKTHYPSYEDAVEAMKRTSDAGLDPLIKDESIKEVTTKGKHVTITFGASAQLSDSNDHILLIEGLLLSAKDFGFTEVTIQQAGADQVGPYELEEPIEVPALPNPVVIRDR
ncbi:MULTISPECIES: sigma X negative regulator [unclassified Bacillus (in: firmicutes)]|uniref:sigma X negative regulator n=1 Tax=unclassified Bacillus (in: firmicutes) TaxID=185979 RepID=UPI000D02D9EC|nr:MULTISPECIES: sigma X negative regulator [unclassified Bacillus (in: firmicutes)]PRS83704.1 sigma X negative regulator [Bacillus sp. CJCL2]PRS88450.1 sigma X negative regulator [Bacillus sp. YBWC18]